MSAWILRGLERAPALAIAVMLYVIAVGGTTVYSYMQTQSALLAQTDRELLLAADSVRFILADDFHDRATAPDAISADEDKRNISALSAFARRGGITFLCSAIDQDGEVRLTARGASVTAEAGAAAVPYATPYGEGRALITRALRSKGPITETYTDRWGTFRAVLVPEVGRHGQVYVVAAGHDLGKVNRLQSQAFLQSILNAVLLLAAPLPLLFEIVGRLRLSEARLKRAVAARTRELQRLAAVDPLTGLPNRRTFDEALEREVRRSARSGTPFCIALLDIDWFKSVNDTFGHPTGDRVLQAFAATVADGLRKSDLVARTGGEEFSVLLPETPMEKAVITAERLCARVRALTIMAPTGATIGITMSVGVASNAEGIIDLEGIVQIADERLYLAKSQGRDRVVAGQAPERAGFQVRDPQGAVEAVPLG